MFTEEEIDYFLVDPRVMESVKVCMADFKKKEIPYLEISEHDFLSLIMVMPSVGLALADKKLSFLEELALNKKARKMSKGKFFLKKDPVAHAMKYVIKKYDTWEAPFFSVINTCLVASIDSEEIKKKTISGDLAASLAGMPYIFVRFLSTLFMPEDKIPIQEHAVKSVVKEKMSDMGEKLGLKDYEVFNLFIDQIKTRK